ncbi:hypothetical protein VPHD479_0219 [Vibrio phage D479]
MKMHIYIEVDYNDGDYVGDVKEITRPNLDKLQGILEKMGKKDWYDWGYGECMDEENDPRILYGLTDEEVEHFEFYAPSVEYGFHTIVTVKVFIGECADLLS